MERVDAGLEVQVEKLIVLHVSAAELHNYLA